VGGNPHLFLKFKKMKIKKKVIKESVGIRQTSDSTYSTKKQNVIVTESQLEKLLEKLQK
jgi:hypothetical protein